MKVRWNACYAIGNMLKNSQMRLGQMSWKNELFDLLTTLTKSCKNLKVRISAINALGISKCRDDYGSSSDLISIWNSLVEGPANLQSSMNFVEYQHFDHLIDQTCATLCHLLSLIGAEDLNVLYEQLTEERTESLLRYFERYSSRPGTHKTIDDVNRELTKC
ncbi:HEAT repeat-containing protein 6 [Chamberlinius hualienensis]